MRNFRGGGGGVRNFRGGGGLRIFFFWGGGCEILGKGGVNIISGRG